MLCKIRRGVLYEGGLAEAGVCCGVLYKGGLTEAGVCCMYCVYWCAVQG